MMNALKTVYTLYKLLPTFDFKNPPFACAIQGDDSLVLLKPEFLKYVTANEITKISADLGFHVKFVKITTKVVEVDYCSRYFWPTYDHPLGYIPGPKIGKVLNKIGYSKTPVTNLECHARGVALGLYNDVHHIPFLKEWCDRVLELTEKVRADIITNAHSIHSDRCFEANDFTWQHLYVRYGLTFEDLSTFKQNLLAAVALPCYVEFPIDLVRMVTVDS